MEERTVEAAEIRELLAQLDDYGDEVGQVLHLMEIGDAEALVRHFETLLERHPGDTLRRINLAEAYLMNGEAERALELLQDLHLSDPADPDIQSLALDALFALGRPVASFPWVEEPVVIRLGEEVLAACAEILRDRHRVRSAAELYRALDLGGYYAFTPGELLTALDQDPRFVVGEDEIRLRSNPEGVGPRSPGRRPGYRPRPT